MGRINRVRVPLWLVTDFTSSELVFWSPRPESNQRLSLRRAPFYPLNYEEIHGILGHCQCEANFGSRQEKSDSDVRSVIAQGEDEVNSALFTRLRAQGETT